MEFGNKRRDNAHVEKIYRHRRPDSRAHLRHERRMRLKHMWLVIREESS